MPPGRSKVTLQGPCVMRRSASARRRRAESWVQASLRVMALRSGSASSSETSAIVAGVAAAHDAATISRTGSLTNAIVPRMGNRCVGSGVLKVGALVFGVKFATNQGDGGHQIHPDQQ